MFFAIERWSSLVLPTA